MQAKGKKMNKEDNIKQVKKSGLRIKEKKLFNPLGKDDLEHRRIIQGDTTNIHNFNNTKYDWADKMWEIMESNNWQITDIDFTKDIEHVNKLTPAEWRAYKGVTGFLVFLDSINSYNPNILSMFITAPEVNVLFNLQGRDEALHSKSYGTQIETIVPLEEREEVYNYWKDDEILLARITSVANVFQILVDNPTIDNLFKAIVAMYILEGLYFYNGFVFFYLLASRGLMPGTADNIRHINKDELQHVSLGMHILNTIKEEMPDLWNEQIVYELMKEAVDAEITWVHHIIGNDIVGMTKESTATYAKHLANKRLKAIGLDPMYENTRNPFTNLEKLADDSGDGDVKANFFTGKVTSYQQSSALKGLDKI